MRSNQGCIKLPKMPELLSRNYKKIVNFLYYFKEGSNFEILQ